MMTAPTMQLLIERAALACNVSISDIGSDLTRRREMGGACLPCWSIR